jgi:C4-dicarboxylate-specific signal transduction histidine kinase
VLLNVVTSADAVASAPFAAPGERADGGDPTSGTVLVIVRDRGPGLAEGSEEQIFEPFVTTKASGMGMGLAVARSLVDNHGGSIRAANHPEGGAVVTISIPALAARVASPVAAVHS